MSDKAVITDPEEKKDKPLIEEIRSKSFQELVNENAEERNKPQKEAPVEKSADEKAKEEETTKAKEAEDAKAKEDAAKQEADRQAALATKAAEEVVKKQEEEKQRELDKAKAEEAEKARQEALKPKFTGVDEKGNVTPKDYDELALESARIGEEKAYARIKAEQEAAATQAKQEQDQKTQAEEQAKEKRQALENQLQKELDSDLTDLYSANKLPKIKDPNNENDPGVKEQRNLFEIAQKVNAERMAKGEPPIRSIKLIYYEHYKPLEKPAGHNAPVLGAESSVSNELPEDKYIPSRDRNKSIEQLVKEEAIKFSKKIGIRSK